MSDTTDNDPKYTKAPLDTASDAAASPPMQSLPQARLRFQVSMEISVSVDALSDELKAKTLRFYGGRTPETDPDLAAEIARDQRLLDALVAHPQAFALEALRRVVWELDSIRRADDILDDISATGELTDQRLVEYLRDALPAEDAAFLQECVEDDLFYDNTSFYQAALSTETGPIHITTLDPNQVEQVERSANSNS